MNIKIEKGIKLPPRVRPGYSKVFRKMKVGESFVAEREKISGVYSAARLTKVRVTIRKINGTMKVRVWRTA